MPIDGKEFRHLLGHFAAGVTIITTTGSDDKPYGLTATAFCSVSLDPPLVLICVDKKAESHPHLEASGAYAVNFLSEEQIDLSNRFAVRRRQVPGRRLTRSRLEFAAVTRGPGAFGMSGCGHRRAGDHTIFVGLVEAGTVSGGAPLMHFNGPSRLAQKP
jgi:flavin reductase (DIM6/NTAB) family NADH-FMN oxidoreductase RutF